VDAESFNHFLIDKKCFRRNIEKIKEIAYNWQKQIQ